MQKHTTPDWMLEQGFSATFADRFWNKVEITHGCWLWIGCLRKGKRNYGKIEKGARGVGSIQAHVASWLIHRGPIQNGLCVLHQCDNPPCCNPDHLFVGTKLDNARDAMKKDRHSRGERNGTSKLTDADVLEIINLWDSGLNGRELSVSFGISQQVISKIVNRTAWKHLAIDRPRLAWGHPGQLKDCQVFEIRRLARLGDFNNQEIADKFNVCRKTVFNILAGRTWKHI